MSTSIGKIELYISIGREEDDEDCKFYEATYEEMDDEVQILCKLFVEFIFAI